MRDSKKLNPKQRGIWFKYVKKHPDILYCTRSVSPSKIDKINISKAANLAATRAIQKLLITNGLADGNLRVFLDGGLYLNHQALAVSGCQLKPKTIIKGDEKIPVIALASIVAKVTRDREMDKLHREYPQYGFDKHKGYGTKKHAREIKRCGLSPAHRKSFKLKNI